MVDSRIHAALALTLTLGPSLCVSASHAAGDGPGVPEIGSLTFLAGSWLSEEEEPTVEEVWSSPGGGVMLGYNRTLTAGRPAAWEFLRIAEEEEGVVYWASPGGVEPTPFRLVEVTESSAVFENPEHDFPQRLTYRRDGDRLVAIVEAERDGETVGFELRWRRVSAVP